MGVGWRSRKTQILMALLQQRQDIEETDAVQGILIHLESTIMEVSASFYKLIYKNQSHCTWHIGSAQ